MSEREGTPINIKDYVGFVYVITNLHTNKKYIGQKLFWKRVKRKPLKGQKRIRRCKVESDWKNYYSSSKALQSDLRILGKKMFGRKILMLCNSKAEMNYEETRLQFEHQVLLSPSWYNGMINCRISKNQIPDYMGRRLV